MMLIITEDKLKSWTLPASDTEEGRCERTIQLIKDCINDYNFGELEEPEIFLRGSYRNNTNVKLDSDIDMYALFNKFYFERNSDWTTPSTFLGGGPSYYVFRDAIIDALTKKYGNAVKLGNKSITLKDNGYRVDADIVPVVQLKLNDIKGVCFFSQKNEFIVNFPAQDYENGCKKNIQTNHRYKEFVRIFKKIRNELEDILQKQSNISSYVIESLLYNIPNNFYDTSKTYTKTLEDIITYLYDNINKIGFVETNGIKKMFCPQYFPEQKTTKADIQSLLQQIYHESLWDAA